MNEQQHRPSRTGELPDHVTQDAVVVVPGIMGSALYDTTTRKEVWGIGGISWLLRAWTTPSGLKPLAVTEDELAGKTGRIKATGLLKHSAWTPYLAGSEPYTDLVDTIGTSVADPAAILEFAYDWRLPVAVNGRLLADAARLHLTAWRRHPAHTEARRHRTDQREGRLVFVAHSMGGLVTRAALDPGYDGDLQTDTRGVITLGTPFQGSVKAAVILATGRGTPVPLPHRKLRAICATMPGLHDLLPQYRSLRAGDDVRHLTPSDVESIGGNAELTRAAARFHHGQKAITLPGHRSVVGVNQPTWQNLTITGGTVTAHLDGVRQNSDGTFIRDRHDRVRYFQVHGDGTVYKESAILTDIVTHLPLQHGDVARARTALDAVTEILRDDLNPGPPQGQAGCGLTAPDLVEAGHPWKLRLTGIDSLPGLTARLTDLSHPDHPTPPLPLTWEDGVATATATTPAPGLYRIEVHTPDGFDITQLVMSTEPGQTMAESEN
ncbi:lipase/acyltransferase domain-containing protein [Streptomyces sp. NPDC001591]|uniref:lipase/acyltransferase domain-containing protein n=1 Tax=Streptomyces sp. NPDC001591 TaxID=3364589 RepID=UPI0036974E28